jgi:hypothetical protein
MEKETDKVDVNTYPEFTQFIWGVIWFCATMPLVWAWKKLSTVFIKLGLTGQKRGVK